VLEKVGAGGMGVVYLAEDIRLERRIALKLLPPGFEEDPQRRRRFLTEAKAASALNHPNVCVIYEVGETDNHHPYIAMEYVNGDARLANRT
jgi:serine/threonine protein kinase